MVNQFTPKESWVLAHFGVCPICGNKYEGYPAISRKDNKTPICPDCGVREALTSFVSYMNTGGTVNG